MNIYKLDAISSTNDFLKELTKQKQLENFTVVSTQFQTNGKGQASNKWISDKGKNLLFSMLVKCSSLKIENQAYLNFAISLAIFNVLKKYLASIYIKWPNDIMADDQKICGILIENTVKYRQISQSIVGIGLNVNQLNFKNLPNAVSLAFLLKKELNSDLLLEALIISIKKQVALLENSSFKNLKIAYEKHLFKKGIYSSFKTNKGVDIYGKIIGVSANGLLQIELDNGVVKEFANKEILYTKY